MNWDQLTSHEIDALDRNIPVILPVAATEQHGAHLPVAHLAHSFNLPVAPHAYQLVHLHLACATPNLRIVEYLGVGEQGDSVWYKDFPKPVDGMWSPYPDRPGLGLELNPDTVARMRTD